MRSVKNRLKPTEQTETETEKVSKQRKHILFLFWQDPPWKENVFQFEYVTEKKLRALGVSPELRSVRRVALFRTPQ